MAIDKKWIVREPGNPALVRQLASELGIDQTLANLLVQRKIKSQSEARAFLKPQLEQLHDPFLMKDMDKAVARLTTALESKEKILIYGDYDVDGTTAVSLVYSFLRKYGEDNLEYYIPNRYTEGYGISYKGIDWASENGFTLIIALDCGIKSVEKVNYAKERGIDFIICDHHLPDEFLPEASAVLDPKRTDCSYPFDDLSGCGVGFKFMQAFASTKSIPFDSLLPLLDLLVVSIASDLVSITGENRVLAYYGLKQLNQSPRKGLLSIIKLSGLEKHMITIDDIVFKIGPRINAAGRMESGKTAVDLLTSRSDNDARIIGDTINTHNNDRKNEDRKITLEASEMATTVSGFANKKSTVVYNPDWHKGVLGIVASRLVENYYKPTIVLCRSNGFITGSARSIPGFDLYDAIENCSDLLENFGGHMYAAGLTLKEENFELFSQRFEEFVASKITAEILTPVINIDTYLDFKQITPRFFNVLKQFQPFGPGNLSPVFISERVYDNGNGRKVGSESGHLKLELIQEDDFHRHISAIAFNRSEHFEHLKSGNPVDICYSIAENYYRGIANLQLRVRDIKLIEDPI
ncbi:MAG: single-stranded-DNA-specific exonuclease RecJ [Bacteroidetes bacterium GWE2_39_28]|nr:MAG: single-stranded-DNA-specific exonuclease RecJ [Bacteroidetes bacterium GWE2_39_28]OFY13263.1 MAG: single-stranded-DNA-specific exonuclease RecJ [Bacteroidetes bacterium GWF2_39_10]OFZ07453.1 MAG: single-stranded-DNA-specific exonuclease RecJ [Bacteroidetes bacterium RIFOXYB2_FULL_39_7]OFZ11450.1 MAG: single-stranded-DNA-specific exonuclease RecJ [Bacteroidetes bacterium RIFOXYC2_FULL_39_11]HCT94078.1 single-stranded-DNA-specific exonuclease RecJ [Rikenellaceae bacterium]